MTSTAAPHMRQRSTSVPAVVGRVLILGVTAAITVWLAPVLIGLQSWLWLGVLLVGAVGIFVLYGTKRFVPGKYLFPGSFLLAVFLILPILLTVQYSFTNYGDGTRGTKEQAITSIVSNSVQQDPDAPRYNLSVASQGSPTEGPFVFFLVDPTTGDAFVGSETEEMTPLEEGDATIENGFVTEASGYELLDADQVNEAYNTISQTAVPFSETSAVRPLGVNQAFVGTTTLRYDEDRDVITDVNDGTEYTIGDVGGYEAFVGPDGTQAFSQSWMQGIGLDNYKRLFTNSEIASQFFAAFVWTLVFAVGSVATTFVLGFFLALVLNDQRLKGRRLYRSILLMPYAVPGFISLLIWSNFYNQDFGLINQMLNLNLNWMGDPTLAKVAVLLTNLWMGFPYMFIVCTGALQAIPSDVMEAAQIDGASRFQTTLKVTSPLLLVSVAPLLVASFAFNFNNFNAIQLLTQGGPFAPGEYTRGGTDILISMIYRIAFGGSGADFGFAAAVSVMLFILTGIIAALQFRFTNVLEDVN